MQLLEVPVVITEPQDTSSHVRQRDAEVTEEESREAEDLEYVSEENGEARCKSAASPTYGSSETSPGHNRTECTMRTPNSLHMTISVMYKWFRTHPMRWETKTMGVVWVLAFCGF